MNNALKSRAFLETGGGGQIMTGPQDSKWMAQACTADVCNYPQSLLFYKAKFFPAEVQRKVIKHRSVLHFVTVQRLWKALSSWATNIPLVSAEVSKGAQRVRIVRISSASHKERGEERLECLVSVTEQKNPHACSLGFERTVYLTNSRAYNHPYCGKPLIIVKLNELKFSP